MGVPINKKFYRVEMSDGSMWQIPIDFIATHRAVYYSDKHPEEGDFNDQLQKTFQLFENDNFEIEDWAISNLSWKDVAVHAKRVKEPEASDYEDGWKNGDVTIVEENDPA